jgi:regulator of protease activity HflC (stomatin/prohibitin superfamily)
MFRFAEFLILIAMFWLLANLIRYCFFRASRGGVIFRLSDSWIKGADQEKKGREEMNRKRKGMVAGVVVAVLVLIGLLLFMMSFGWVTVNPTEVAVQVNKIGGTVSTDPLGVGYHFYNRWKTDMQKYDIAVRSWPEDVEKSENRKEYTLELKTKDGQKCSIDVTLLVALRKNEVPELHKQIGIMWANQVLLPQMRSESRIVIGSYTAEELYDGTVRDKVQQAITAKLVLSMAKYPAIDVKDSLLRHLEFDPQFEKAILDKKLASQTVEINKNLALAQEEMAKKQEAEAKGLKLQAVQAAQGRAEAVKVEADASKYKLEAEAQGNLAKYKAEAEGKRLLTDAVGGGQNLVALTFAQNIPDKLQIWGVPTGQNSTSLMDVSGIFGNMFPKPTATK